MSDLVGNPEDRFSHNEAHIFFLEIKKKLNEQREKRIEAAKKLGKLSD